jgi:hypothetical protein
MEFLNNFLKDFALEIIIKADEIRRDMSSKKVVTASDIETSIKLMSRNPIATNMINEGKKLVELIKEKNSKQRKLTENQAPA